MRAVAVVFSVSGLGCALETGAPGDDVEDGPWVEISWEGFCRDVSSGTQVHDDVDVRAILADQIIPRCMEGCVEDVDEETYGLQATCELIQSVTNAEGEVVTTMIPNCNLEPLPNAVGACFEEVTGSDVDFACSSQGYNLQIVLTRDPAIPVPCAWVMEARCRAAPVNAGACS